MMNMFVPIGCRHGDVGDLLAAIHVDLVDAVLASGRRGDFDHLTRDEPPRRLGARHQESKERGVSRDQEICRPGRSETLSGEDPRGMLSFERQLVALVALEDEQVVAE